MTDTQEWLGIYTSDSEGKPVALVPADGPVHAVRRAVAAQPGGIGRQTQVAAVDVTVPENADIKAFYAQPEASDQPDAQAAADDVLKAQIRTEIEAEERRSRLVAEVRREMAAESPDPKPLRERGARAESKQESPE